jgi:hypothetical protein
MQLKTILNRLQTQPGFVYGAVRFGEAAGRLHLEVELRRRANRQPRCAGCQRARPGYDTLPPRRFVLTIVRKRGIPNVPENLARLLLSL